MPFDLGKLFEGAVSTLTGGLVDLGGQYYSNELIGRPNAAEAYAQSQSAAAKAYDRNVQFYKNRYKWMMEDMKRAGLNPILAAASGMSTSSSPQAQPAQAFQARYPTLGVASSARDIAQAGLFKEQKEETIANTFKLRAEKGLIDQNEKLAFEKTNEMINRVQVTGREIEKTIAQTKYWERKGDLTEIEKRRERENIKNIKKLRGRISAETKTLLKNLTYLSQRSDLYEGGIGKAFVLLKEILGPLGLGFLLGGAGGAALRGIKAAKGMKSYPQFIKGMFKKGG